VVDIEDSSFEGGQTEGALSYDSLLAEGDPEFDWSLPDDEWDAISLNYTSGTTGNPKGVVYHHRGAALNATSNILTWGMPQHPVYLWTLPMFHCNGWCFPWTMAANAGTSVCLRAVRDEAVFRAFRDHQVTHFCGAPIVLNMLANARDAQKQFDHAIKVMTAGAPPPAAVIEKMEMMGIEVTHVYGLTETYGPSVVCAWKDEWNTRSGEERATLKVRQGVKYVALSGLMVADPDTLEPVPADGETMGEIFMQGNIVMKGYLKNPDATEKAFRGGWFASGDLGVMHPDGYVALKDRSKDIIISGGENISSVEVEDVLYKHPAVLEAAVVARPDEKWGETPCAFVELKPGADADAASLIGYCRDNMAHFKAPKTVVFGILPKTSTGKIQKFLLRDRARAL
jgi:fatty-acyl-CoA synthase